MRARWKETASWWSKADQIICRNMITTLSMCQCDCFIGALLCSNWRFFTVLVELFNRGFLSSTSQNLVLPSPSITCTDVLIFLSSAEPLKPAPASASIITKAQSTTSLFSLPTHIFLCFHFFIASIFYSLPFFSFLSAGYKLLGAILRHIKITQALAY